MNIDQLPWDQERVFVTEISVSEADIDRLGHTNNTHYIRWCEETAWAHSASLGVHVEDFIATRRALAIRRSEFDYLSATGSGDHLYVGTWIVDWGDRLIKDRYFQIIRAADKKTVTRGMMQFVCVDMDSHGVRKMPKKFIDAYRKVALPDKESSRRPRMRE